MPQQIIICGVSICVIRDYMGRFMASANWKCKCMMEPMLVEAIGVTKGLHFAKKLDFTEVIVETDCTYLVIQIKNIRVN